MLKTFFSGLEWERHRHQMGLAAGGEGEDEEEGEGRATEGKMGEEKRRKQSLKESRHKRPHLTDCIVLTNPRDSTRSSANKPSLPHKHSSSASHNRKHGVSSSFLAPRQWLTASLEPPANEWVLLSENTTHQVWRHVSNNKPGQSDNEIYHTLILRHYYPVYILKVYTYFG